MKSRPTRFAAQRRGPRDARGFTLTELMITVAIVAIVAAIAVPAYQDYTRNARRAEAVSLLADLASRQEQYFLDNRTYTSNIASLGLASPLTTDGGHYTISIPAASATTYTLQAAPIASQATPECGTLTMDNNQTKTPAACFTK